MCLYFQVWMSWSVTPRCYSFLCTQKKGMYKLNRMQQQPLPRYHRILNSTKLYINYTTVSVVVQESVSKPQCDQNGWSLIMLNYSLWFPAPHTASSKVCGLCHAVPTDCQLVWAYIWPDTPALHHFKALPLDPWQWALAWFCDLVLLSLFTLLHTDKSICQRPYQVCVFELVQTLGSLLFISW